MTIISNVFRTINSKLITTDNIVVEKILKLFFFISLIVYRYDRKKKRESTPVVINNFDGNIKMKVDRARVMGAGLYWTGFHEFREFLFLHRFLKKDMVFVDVGANQGEYALFAAKRLFQGSVLAFEPLPSIRKVLHENILLNGFKNIQVFDCGLSDKTDTLVIHEIEDMNEGLATFYLGNLTSKAEISVQLKSLDQILTALPETRIDFMKIDVEGGELNALKGSVKTIEKYKPFIMIEINNGTYKAAGYTIANVENFFYKINYIPYSIGKRGRLIKCQTLPAFGNIVFKPE